MLFLSSEEEGRMGGGIMKGGRNICMCVVVVVVVVALDVILDIMVLDFGFLSRIPIIYMRWL